MSKIREELIQKTRKEDERSDLKQHADKMLRDFEKFNEYSSNRAIWELVQNACDLSKECKIEIDYTNDNISFSHNGKAFTSNSLISLIKQVSGKYGNQANISEVGKYGTGFLSTHTFGRKFIIDSILDAGGYYLPIKNFKVDRTPKKWEDLSDNISDQKHRVFQLLDNEYSVEVEELKTTFTYLPETQREIEYIDRSLIGLDDYIPLVFTINDRLKEVKLINNNGDINYFRFLQKTKIENGKGINLYESIILKNSEERHIYSIIDCESEIEIILPINKNHEVYQFDSKIARLFYYYPLIGSENFGINFIINCKKFLPTEPRDGIHLKSDKEQVSEQEEINRAIIDKCSDLIFEFLGSNVIDVKNPLLYADVNFKTYSDNRFLNEYFEDLQSKWNKNLNPLPFVNTNQGYKSIEEAIYLSEDFLDQDDEVFDCFYELISKFYKNIPVKDDVIIWSNYANNWNNGTIGFINHEDLLNKISECKLDDFNTQVLINYYQHLIDNKHAQIFNDFELLPNIEGNFNKLSFLLKSKDLNEKLMKLGKVLIPESMEKIIHPDFLFDFPLDQYHRRHFSNDVKNQLDKKELTNSIYYPDFLKEEDYHMDLIEKSIKIEESYFKSLLDFSKMVNSVESTSKPNQIIKKISKYYGRNEDLISLPKVSDENENIEHRYIRKTLIQIFFNIISLHNKEWVRNNLDFLYELILLNDDSYKEVFKQSGIYPNQLFELHQSECLKRDLDVEDDIKKFHFNVLGDDVNEVLIVKEFNEFLSDGNFINNKFLTAKIEHEIFNYDVNDLNTHPNKDSILEIIPKLTDKHYQELFQLLNEKKANIMISVVSKEETKDDIFAIVTLEDDKLNYIGKLIRNPKFENILNQAANTLEEESQKNANFQFKHKIGVHMENKLREYLKIIFHPEDIKCEVLEEQNGQDIVIKIKGEIKYFIEVKSRWDKRTSVKMSRNQTLRSHKERENYALCSIDMTDYNNEDKYEVSDLLKISNNITFVNNIGNQVEHLIDVFKQTSADDKIQIDGDYRALVPQKIIENNGMCLSSFETYLVDFLKEHS